MNSTLTNQGHFLWSASVGRQKISLMLILALLSFTSFIPLFLSCAPKTPLAQQQEKPGSTQQENASLSGSEFWQERWKKTLSAAQKEGSVVVYASVTEAPPLKEVMSLFKEKFGIKLELVSGRGTELASRIIQEQKNGLFIGDILPAGLNTVYGSVKPAGALVPLDSTLILPEVVDPKSWIRGELPWGDKDHYVFIYYAYPSPMISINTSMVKPGEITSYFDLLDPKWKDKVLLGDPTVTGTSFNGFASLIYSKVVDLDFFRQLISQQNQALRDQRLHVDWLARGKYPVALWALSSYSAEYQLAGAPISEIDVKEGSYLSSGGGNLTMLKNAPHPNASIVFINWLLSKDGQLSMQKSIRVHSARVDLPTDMVDAQKVRKPGQKYFVGANSIEEWVLKEQDKYMEYARQVFGPVLK